MSDTAEFVGLLEKNARNLTDNQLAASLKLPCDALAANDLFAYEVTVIEAANRIRELSEKIAKHQEFAKAHEAWESRMILEGKHKILENMTDDAYEEAMEIQRLRNKAMQS